MVPRFLIAIVVVACIASGCLETEDCKCDSCAKPCKTDGAVKEQDASSNNLQPTCEHKNLQPSDNTYSSCNTQQSKVSNSFAWFELFLPQWKNIIASLRAMDDVSKARAHGTHGRTMLHFLISHHDADLSLLKDLLDVDVDVNAVDNFGQTPLHLAVITGKTEFVKLLLDMGAEIHHRNEAGSSALMLALLLKNDDIVNELLQHNNGVIASEDSNDIYPNENVDALHVAIHVGASESVFKQLLELAESKESLQRCDNEWRDLNIGYWRYPEFDCRESCKEAEPEVGGITITRVGPLIHHTIHKCRKPLMKLLLNIEGTLFCKDPDGATPLHVAVDCCPDVVDDFIVSEALVNEQDCSGQTPLHYAAKHGDETIIKKLIESGASCIAKDKQDQTPIEYAQKSNRSECSSLLKDVIAQEAKEELAKSCSAASKCEGVENDDDISKHTVVIHDYEGAVETNETSQNEPAELAYTSAGSKSRAHRFLPLVIIAISLFIL